MGALAQSNWFWLKLTASEFGSDWFAKLHLPNNHRKRKITSGEAFLNFLAWQNSTHPAMSQSFFTLSPNIRGKKKKTLSQMWLLMFPSFQMAITWSANKCQLVDFIQRLVGSPWVRLRKGSGANVGCHVLALVESMRLTCDVRSGCRWMEWWEACRECTG